MNLAKITGPVLALAIVAGCSGIETRRGAVDAGEGLRLGVLADTQSTTLEKTSGYLFRTMRADAVENVAIRTAAQEFLSVDQLGYLLGDVASRGPDAVLYLGDAANSGCADELAKVFGVLSAARESSGIPIFFAVGNHDYLATGNQASPEQRSLACGGKDYDTKAELVVRASVFNRESWERFAKPGGMFRAYTDSVDAVNAIAGHGCRASEPLQQVDGCFYAAVLAFEKQGRKGELILVDTSDYESLVLNPAWLGGPTWAEGRGLRGGVSYSADGQNGWILAHTDDSGLEFRYLASHYPTRDLNWFNLPSGRIGDLLAEGARNVWLSAHTHQPDPDDPVVRGLSYSGPWGLGGHSPPYDEVNTGSTTDHRAHGSIVEFVDGRAEKTPVLALGSEGQAGCISWLENLRLDAVYGYPLPGVGDTRVRLGLTADYRKADYGVAAAQANIQRLLETAEDKADRERMVRCLMYVAAETESRAD